MVIRYWRDVSRRAFWEAARSARIESREAVMVVIAGQTILAVVLWVLAGDMAIETRAATAALPFLLFLPLYVWKLLETPARLASEARAEHAVTRQNLEQLQNEASATASADTARIGALEETVRDLARKIGVSETAHQPDLVEKLRRMTPSELRQSLADLADEMRVFENARWKTLITVHDEGANRAKRFQQRHNEIAAEFGRNYRPRARAFQDELYRRLGTLPPDPWDDIRTMALSMGGLAGPSPISDAADYLEQLARKI